MEPMFLPEVENHPQPGPTTDAVAAKLLGGEALVWSVLRDPESSPLSEKDKALFRFIVKTNHQSASITAGDIRPLHDVWLVRRSDLLRHHRLRAVQFL